MRDLKSLLIIILCFLLPLVACVYFGWDDVNAELSNDTLKEVEKLRWKHEFGTLITSGSITGVLFHDDCAINYNWTSFWFEDGKFFVETQDGKWFIEMTKMEE